MAEETGIAWTDSTFNAWWGCVKVGPECEHCYAETLDLSTGGNHWVIVGGESGENFRPMNMEWALNIYKQCLEKNIPFFFKQTGGLDGGTNIFYGNVVQNFPEGI